MNAGATLARCPGCGKVLPADAPEGLCPRCLVARNLVEPTRAAVGDPARPAPPLIPTPTPEDLARRFPQFEVLECLGRGGMGIVYKARQTRLGRLVALKVLSPARAKDPQFAERFQREAQALARLNHPAIVTVHEFGETDGLYFLVMEYVDGASLRDVLRQGRVPPHLALSIIPKLCEALQFAHDQGVVHRDIKPENILLDRQGRVKIADFGIAKCFGEPTPMPPLTEARAIVGTPHYMAPEQVEHPQSVDHRADIYSLGVVFYELLTGELPLGRFAPPSQKAAIDERLDPVVLRALEKEPTYRYQHAAQVGTDVASIAATFEPRSLSPTVEPTASTPPTGTSPQRQGILHDPAPSLRFLALGVGAVGILNAATVLLILLLAVVLVQCDRLGIDLDGPLPELARWLQDPSPHGLRLGLAAVGYLILTGGGLTVLGAVRLHRLQSYRMGVMACVLAMVLPPALFLGLPLGIWGLVILGRRTTQARFAAAHLALGTRPHAHGHTPDPASPSKSRHLRSFAWMPVAALALLVVVSRWLGSEGTAQVTLRERALAAELKSRQEAVALALARHRQRGSTTNTVESSPPVVIHTVPTSGDTHVPSDLRELRVTFSKPMKDGHWTWIEWKAGSLPDFAGEPRFLEDKRTCILPIRVLPGRAYALWINSEQERGFQDLGNRSAIPYLLHFQVAPDAEPPP